MPRTPRRAILGLAAAIVCSPACSSPSSPSATAPLTLTRFAADPTALTIFGGYDQPQTLVVHDRDTWVRTWSDIQRRVTPAPALPDVDFSKDLVVVASLGSRPSSGFDIVLTSASEANGVVTVEVQARSPGPNCVVAAVVTSPVDAARLTRRSGAVVFHTTPVVVDCPNGP